PLGSVIRARRQWLGIGVRDLALLIGVDETFLRNLESGVQAVPMDRIVRIAQALSMEWPELISAGRVEMQEWAEHPGAGEDQAQVAVRGASSARWQQVYQLAAAMADALVEEA